MVGLTPEDVADQQEITLWPDTVEPYLIFCDLDDQWLVGPGGPYALNNQGIESGLRLLGIPRKRWPALFTDLRALQAGALQGIAQNEASKPR